MRRDLAGGDRRVKRIAYNGGVYMKNNHYASCLDGYLTEGCKTCEDWCDGSNGSIGCGTHYPIAWCPYFSEMMRRDNEKRKELEVKEQRRKMFIKHFNKKSS